MNDVEEAGIGLACPACVEKHLSAALHYISLHTPCEAHFFAVASPAETAGWFAFAQAAVLAAELPAYPGHAPLYRGALVAAEDALSGKDEVRRVARALRLGKPSRSAVETVASDCPFPALAMARAHLAEALREAPAEFSGAVSDLLQSVTELENGPAASAIEAVRKSLPAKFPEEQP